jgi:ankyrin repeat protein
VDITSLKRAITNASKQIPKGIKTACTDSLEIKTKELLNKENHCINSQQEKEKLKELVQEMQSKLVRKYLKKTKGTCKDQTWKNQEVALNTACRYTNIKVIKTLLSAGVNPNYPTPDNQADKILLNCNEKIAQTILAFYDTYKLKELMLRDPKREENIKKLSRVSIHSPHKNFPPQWLVNLAKKELSKKMLESKNKERTINIEI